MPDYFRSNPDYYWNERPGRYGDDYPSYEETRGNMNGPRFSRRFHQSRLNRGPSNQWGNYRSQENTHYAPENPSYFGTRGYPYGGYETENRHRFESDGRYEDQGDELYRGYNRFDYENGGSRHWPADQSQFDEARRLRYARQEEGLHRGKGPRGYTRSDERIREDINDRLCENPYVDATDIHVAVTRGDIMLTGTVDSRSAKRMAEDIAESVLGVVNVENRIRVSVPDQLLKEDQGKSGRPEAKVKSKANGVLESES